MLGEGLVGQVRKGGPAPQRERTLEHGARDLGTAGGELASALGQEPLEARGIEALGIELEPVAVLAGHDRVRPAVVAGLRERLPQA